MLLLTVFDHTGDGFCPNNKDESRNLCFKWGLLQGGISIVQIMFVGNKLAICLLAGFCWTYFFHPEDGRDMFLRNVGWNSTDYTASYPRRLYSPWLPLWKLQVLHNKPCCSVLSQACLCLINSLPLPRLWFSFLSVGSTWKGTYFREAHAL
jgi:hypothetical protein